MGPDFSTPASAEETCNNAIFAPGMRQGHYESYFQRANHPTKPLAFWIRYTVFCPKGAPDKAIGELWAIFFDGEQDQVTAVKHEVPIAECAFDRSKLNVNIGGAELSVGRLHGAAASGSSTIDWALDFDKNDQPLFFLPLSLYSKKIPKAKALVAKPNAVFSGTIKVNGQDINIDRWTGSQNHNWGVKHTDQYAWGQVCGFDGAEDAFLEVGTARLKFGPIWTPFMTPLVLRVGDREFVSNKISRALKNKGSYSYFDWSFQADTPEAVIDGRIHAPGSHFVALEYYNPPGGSKTCLNSKIASCEITIRYKDQRPPQTLTTKNRAAFEILTDDDAHGMQRLVP